MIEDALNKTDKELLYLTLKDKENYRYLIERYEDKLKWYIVRLSGLKMEDAEDILQEVFLKAYINLNDFDSNFKFSSWIYRITHNETIIYLRKMNSRPKTIGLEVNPEFLNTLHADLNEEDNLDLQYFRQNVNKIIDGLDDKYRTVLILKYLEDKDYEEISDILKKPKGTVGILLKRAKEKVKKEILNRKNIFETYGRISQ